MNFPVARDTATLALLWIAVLIMGIWVGGTIYQMVVIVPIWTAAAPESLRSFLKNTNFRRNVLRFFGPRWMPVRVFSVLGLVPCGWNWPVHRVYFLVAAVCVVIGVAFTFAYVYPLNRVLFDQAGGDHADAEVRALLRRWILADRARLAVLAIGYVCLLRALSLGMLALGR